LWWRGGFIAAAARGGGCYGRRGWPPGAETVLRRLAFAGPATLAAHGQGVLGWALVVLAVRPGLFGRVI
jgi:hypothetical protein